MGLNHTCEHNPHSYPFVALWTYSIIGVEKWKPTPYQTRKGALIPIPSKEMGLPAPGS